VQIGSVQSLWLADPVRVPFDRERKAPFVGKDPSAIPRQTVSEDFGLHLFFCCTVLDLQYLPIMKLGEESLTWLHSAAIYGVQYGGAAV
jgi:hypothetical protein